MLATDRRFAELKAEAHREWARRERERTKPAPPPPSAQGPLARTVGVAALKLLVIVVLPFALLVRGAVSLYTGQGAPTWLALGGALALTAAVVTGYAVWLSRTLTGRARVRLMAQWVALPLVSAWCLYALLVLARANVKTDAVRAHYTATHPVLRLALSTVLLVDPDLVVTDLGRAPEDYARMGLSAKSRTLHYPQADGWVHAVDLRTAGRGAVQNRLVQLYFWAMGFETLRHTGTADHLHVELALQ